jgi:hypothetical protein
MVESLLGRQKKKYEVYLWSGHDSSSLLNDSLPQLARRGWQHDMRLSVTDEDEIFPLRFNDPSLRLTAFPIIASIGQARYLALGLYVLLL